MKKPFLLAAALLLLTSSVFAEVLDYSPSIEGFVAPIMPTGYVLIVLPQYNFVDDEYSITKVNISRAGYTVEVCSTSTKELALGSDIIKVRPNLTIDQIDTGKYKGVIYVGSYMSRKFFENPILIAKSKEFKEKGVLIGAMDNTPYFMAKWGLLGGLKVTVNTTLAKSIKSMGINYIDKNIVIDTNIITVDQQKYSDAFAQEFITELAKR